MRLEVALFGTTFQNPVLLAAGTCGFGRELAGVVDLEALGGLVTKSVTLEPRAGNPAPRVAEFPGGMLNSIGLANPGLDATVRDKLPWLRDNVRRARVFVSLAGHREEEYPALVEGLDGADGFLGYELNLSCPNDRKLGGLPFALDPDAVGRVVEACRGRTGRPLVAKLAPNDPDPTATARRARDAGADGVTLANTLPGLLLDPADAAPVLGAGAGGMSGPALLPVALAAVARVAPSVPVPVIGAGGIVHGEDALRYLRAGAVLVQIGTASFASPRAAEGVVAGLARLGRRFGVEDVRALAARSRPSEISAPVAGATP